MSAKADHYNVNPGIYLSLNIMLKCSLLVIFFVLVYYETLSSLVGLWVNRPDYSHGFLVPFISLYFIWTDRTTIKSLPISPDLISGSFVLLSGSLMFIFGHVGGILLLQQTSLLIVITGLVLTILGRGHLKKLAFPVSYLVFMIPALDVIFENIRHPFQVFSALVASKALMLLGVPVIRSGNLMELPDITLEVARACSGVQYMVSIIAVGIPLAYFTQRNWKRKIGLVVSAVLIAFFINPLRITLIGLWAVNGGEVLHGPMHIFQGLFVSVIGFIALFLLAFIFAKTGPKGPVAASSSGESSVTVPTYITKRVNAAWIISLLILIGVAGYTNLYKPRPVLLRSSLEQLPFEIGVWKGRSIHGNSHIAVHRADSEVSREYINDAGRKVRLYIGYFESQEQDREVTDYRLQQLFDRNEKISIPIGSGPDIQVNKVRLKHSGRTSAALYWYDLNGRIIPGTVNVKLMTAVEMLIKRRSNGAIVIVSVESNSDDQANQVVEDEVKFAQDVIPVLRQLLPAGAD